MDAKIRRNITPFTKGSAWKKSPNIVKSGPLDITSVLTSEFIFKPHRFYLFVSKNLQFKIWLILFTLNSLLIATI